MGGEERENIRRKAEGDKTKTKTTRSCCSRWWWWRVGSLIINNHKEEFVIPYRDHGGDDDEGDPIAKAEEDFWNSISQACKDIAAKEKKQAEASGMGKSQPTPIPEEGVEPAALSDAKPEVDKVIYSYISLTCYH